MSRYRFIEAQREQYAVRLLCQLVQVPASGYYAWQQVQQQAIPKKLFELAEFEHPANVGQANPGVGMAQTLVVFL